MQRATGPRSRSSLGSASTGHASTQSTQAHRRRLRTGTPEFYPGTYLQRSSLPCPTPPPQLQTQAEAQVVRMMPTAGNLDLQEQSKAFWFREDKQWIEQENRIIHRYREACSLPCAATRRQPPHRLSRFYGQGYAESSVNQWLTKRGRPPIPKLTKKEKAAFYEMFDSMDADGSGSIDAEEMMEALKIMGSKISKEQLDEAIRSVDFDGSGQLEKDEFLHMMAETDLFKGDAAREETAGAFPSACKTLQIRGIIDDICGPIDSHEHQRLVMPTLASGKPRGSIFESIDILTHPTTASNPIPLDFSSRASSRRSLTLLRGASLLAFLPKVGERTNPA